MLDIGITGYLAWLALGAIGFAGFAYRIRALLQQRRRNLLRQKPSKASVRTELTGYVVTGIGALLLWASAPFGPPFWLIVTLQVVLGVGLLFLLVDLVRSGATRRTTR